MSMDQPNPNKSRDPREVAEQLLFNDQRVLNEALVLVGAEGQDPLEVFPPSSARREDDPGMDLTLEQESALRQTAAELGFGRTTDRGAELLGLPDGYAAIIEGGQVHKVAAEIMTVLDDATQPGSIFVAGSPNRTISSNNEKQAGEVASVRYQLGLGEQDAVEETEYSVNQKLLQTIPGFKAHAEPVVIPFSYDVQDEFAVGVETSGQLVRVGTIGERSVVMLRIDRNNKEDGSWDKQPGTTDVIKVVDSYLTGAGHQSVEIGFATSATYQASREVDGVRAALETGHNVGVITYGTRRLGAVKGEEVASPASIKQLPGELHNMAKEIQKLDQLLHPAE